MNLYKVLLADDEKNILEGLQYLIDWQNAGCKIVAACTDGRKALEVLQEKQIDIAITDIRMPYMDGLELIQRAATCSSARFIVLSGYSEFAYAQKCVSLNVSGYLLKPVDEEQLMDVLHKVISDIQADAAVLRNRNALNREAKKAQATIRDYAFRDYIGSILDSESDAKSLLKELDLFFPDGNHMALVFRLFEETGIKTENKAQKIIQIMKDSLGYHVELFEFSTNIYVVVATAVTYPENGVLAGQVRFLHQRLLSAVGPVDIGIGCPTQEKRNLSKSVQQAFYALSGKMNQSGCAVLPVWEMDSSRRQVMMIPPDMLNEYKKNLNSLDEILIHKTVDNIFDYFDNRKELPLFSIQMNALNLLLASITQLGNHEVSIDRMNLEDISDIQFLYSLQNITQIRGFVKRILHALLEKVDPAQRSVGKGTVELIQEYFHLNIFSDLSLVAVARKFSISSNYLSQLFKKETGQLYIQYVTELKMEKAKELLQNGHYRVYEVADQLGYKDQRYFSRQFEKHTGKKPTDYKGAN